jgi:hypothetical protein
MTKSPSKKDYHLEGVRDLACNVILQAVEDIWNRKKYKSKHQRAIMVEARRSAKHFLLSRSYQQICSIMLPPLPADKIIDAAFHPAKYPEIIKMLRERKKR